MAYQFHSKTVQSKGILKVLTMLLFLQIGTTYGYPLSPIIEEVSQDLEILDVNGLDGETKLSFSGQTHMPYPYYQYILAQSQLAQPEKQEPQEMIENWQEVEVSPPEMLENLQVVEINAPDLLENFQEVVENSDKVVTENSQDVPENSQETQDILDDDAEDAEEVAQKPEPPKIVDASKIELPGSILDDYDYDDEFLEDLEMVESNWKVKTADTNEETGGQIEN